LQVEARKTDRDFSLNIKLPNVKLAEEAIPTYMQALSNRVRHLPPASDANSSNPAEASMVRV